MNWVTVLGRLQQQTRQSPIVSDSDLLAWMQQAIRVFDNRAQWLEGWHVLPVKASVASYLLPENHLTTVGAWFQGIRVQVCTAWDAQQVSPAAGVYYYEDNWADWASDAAQGEFALHHLLLGELWPLQLCRAQSSHGRKTLTLVSAPTADGTYTSSTSVPATVATTLQTYDQYLLAYTLLPESTNLLVLYKQRGQLPASTTDTVSWSDGLVCGYMARALSYALGTEDDEYDRYRSWMYGFVADQMAGVLKGMAINRRQR